jgi:hypothetical protein
MGIQENHPAYNLTTTAIALSARDPLRNSAQKGEPFSASPTPLRRLKVFIFVQQGSRHPSPR